MACLTGWHRHFGPASGSDPKIRDTLGRYVTTTCSDSVPTSASGVSSPPATMGVSEAQLRRLRRNCLNRDGLRRAIAVVVGETLRCRNPDWWGQGTACASDSEKFGSWSSN